MATKDISEIYNGIMDLILEKSSKLPLNKYSQEIIEGVYNNDLFLLQKIKRELEKL